MNEAVDFLIVNFNTFDFVKILVQSIETFVRVPFYIYIVDTSDQFDLLKKYFANKKNIIIQHQKFVCGNIFINNAVCNHMGGINLAFNAGKSKYVCILDPDTVFIERWMEQIIPLLEENCFISNRFESSLNIARPQLMFFKRQFWLDNGLKFAYYKDTGGNITLFCQQHKMHFHILRNSYNDETLIREHAFPNIYGEQCFINNIPFFIHQGRGASKGDRSQWFSVFSDYLNKLSYNSTTYMLRDILKHVRNKNEFKSTTSLKFKVDIADFLLREQIPGDILEIGTNRGDTTAILAVIAKTLNKTVYSFDNNLELLNIAKTLIYNNKIDNCILVHKDVYKESWDLNKVFGLVFIDAVHEQKAFEMDLCNAEKILLKGGFIIAHDYGLENKCGKPIYEVLNQCKDKYQIYKYIGEKDGWNNLGSGKTFDYEGVIIKIRNGDM